MGILNVENPELKIQILQDNLRNLEKPFNIISIQREVEKILVDVDMPGYMLKLDLSPNQIIKLILLMTTTSISVLNYLATNKSGPLVKVEIKLQIVQLMVNQTVFIPCD